MDKVFRIVLTTLLVILSVAAFLGITEWLGTYSVAFDIIWGYLVGSILAFFSINWWFNRRNKHE